MLWDESCSSTSTYKDVSVYTHGQRLDRIECDIHELRVQFGLINKNLNKIIDVMGANATVCDATFASSQDIKDLIAKGGI